MSRLIAALALACSLIALLPAAASAEVWHADDPSGDVTGFEYSIDPEPCGTAGDLGSYDRPEIDLTGVEVRHDEQVVRVVLGIADARRGRKAAFWIALRTPDGDYSLDVQNRRVRGTWGVRTFLAHQPEPPNAEDLDECGGYWVMQEDVRCPVSASVDTWADRITVELPRRCLGSPRWVRAAVSSYRWQRLDDRSFITMSDQASRAPGFSPRIRPRDGRVR
ncbi:MULTISPECIES: hypothetical protein [unclassified Nocardioides]|uniref:hypothetical protein n=1 Tax=unclassified Nocardioides TaxID=2615069 RepID=UPI00362280DD